AAAADHPTQLDPGNLGLWLTHEKLLQAVGGSPPAHLHILEDDAVLAANAVNVLDTILARMDVQFAGWDLLLTDMFLQPRPDVFVPFLDKMKLFAKTGEYTIIELARIPFACTTSLVLNKASLGKYADLMRGQWELGRPIDIY